MKVILICAGVVAGLVLINRHATAPATPVAPSPAPGTPPPVPGAPTLPPPGRPPGDIAPPISLPYATARVDYPASVVMPEETVKALYRSGASVVTVAPFGQFAASLALRVTSVSRAARYYANWIVESPRVYAASKGRYQLVPLNLLGRGYTERIPAGTEERDIAPFDLGANLWLQGKPLSGYVAPGTYFTRLRIMCEYDMGGGTLRIDPVFDDRIGTIQIL